MSLRVKMTRLIYFVHLDLRGWCLLYHIYIRNTIFLSGEFELGREWLYGSMAR